MSKPKFTPGPWLPHMAFNDAEGFPKLCVDVMKPATKEDYKLIAAAPELYEALEKLLRTLDWDGKNWWFEVRAEARNALAKARGEERKQQKFH